MCVFHAISQHQRVSACVCQTGKERVDDSSIRAIITEQYGEGHYLVQSQNNGLLQAEASHRSAVATLRLWCEHVNHWPAPWEKEAMQVMRIFFLPILASASFSVLLLSDFQEHTAPAFINVCVCSTCRPSRDHEPICNQTTQIKLNVFKVTGCHLSFLIG